ncbi:MAG: hypothetical protein KTR13_00955 [Saprospiraceae bacterium]|nr:hypothetical protein [Saprospiraceae bacterium]
MKNLFFYLFFGAFLLGYQDVSAQIDNLTSEPHERANLLSSYMSDFLGLDTKQQELIEAYNLKYELLIQKEIVDSEVWYSSDFIELLDTLYLEKRAEVKQILDASQMELYVELESLLYYLLLEKYF